MNAFSDYPYEIHTNNELALMLAGEKPFAMFAHERVEGFEKDHVLAGQDFQGAVQAGTISEHKEITYWPLEDGRTLQVDYYFYCLHGEEWRVPAYKKLLELRKI